MNMNMNYLIHNRSLCTYVRTDGRYVYSCLYVCARITERQCKRKMKKKRDRVEERWGEFKSIYTYTYVYYTHFQFHINTMTFGSVLYNVHTSTHQMLVYALLFRSINDVKCPSLLFFCCISRSVFQFCSLTIAHYST